MSLMKRQPNTLACHFAEPSSASTAGHTAYSRYLPAERRLSLQATAWIAALALLAALPLLFSSPFAVSLLTQICIAVTFAVAYNMLLGGTGLLSFGHALYFGLGAYATAHALNHFGGAFPLVLAPLVGWAVSVVAGAFLASFTVRSGALTYAMITLAIGQLAFSAATVLTGWSGGDEGISLDPAKSNEWGIDFGSPVAIYLLIAGWTWLSTVLMFALSRSALGQLMLATRDNPERVEFIGFSPALIRGIASTVSAGFAGVAGALYALGFQVVTMDSLSLPQSTAGLLDAFIGGYASFFGPVVGAALITLASICLASLTHAWPLYLGACFVLVVMFMRNGLIDAPATVARYATIYRAAHGTPMLIAHFSLVCLCGLLSVAGLAAMIELTGALSESMSTPVTLFKAFGFEIVANPHRSLHWIAAIFIFLCGFCGLRFSRRRPSLPR
ncbi:branched-chain amino acid ABC transporter permease [Paraburkholderia sp. JPY432]|nr:branched-chain amino acid ABC transporter permease [Paraburkholderia youngii]